MTGEIIDIFKRGMGETGRFYRKARGARTANGRFALQDEASTLSRISSDLRRRMESANYSQVRTMTTMMTTQLSRM
jgi:hypothetical protein